MVSVPKAIALIWSMLFLEPIPEDFLLSAYSAAQAFLRLEHLDAADAAARQRQADSHWGFAADGGNKGVALNLIAISAWDSLRCKPFMEPLSANKGLAGSLSMAAVSLLFLIKRWDGDVIGEMLELVPLGEEAQSQLLGIIASDFVGCLLLEKATAAIFRY